jgi:uroporphyrinogen decarboxylase
MTKREVVQSVLAGVPAPYTPWSFRFTEEPKAALCRHFGCGPGDLITHTGCHILELGSDIGFFEDLGNDQFRDVFGVVWDRSMDKDIGMPASYLLQEPGDLDRLTFPDPTDPRFFRDIEDRIARFPDRFRLFDIGFSLFERAWTLRSMEQLLIDMIEEPDFVHALLTRIADYNIAQVREALKYDIDAVYFGDDWGQQRGLIMGYDKWKEFIYPQLQRMYHTTREAGKFQFIHSCGDVDELFDDLIGLGLNCFNPFQPEVMHVAGIHARYRSRLTFWGGLSTQSTLPHKGVDAVREESVRLLEMGRRGGYIFSPAHAVESDVPLENILTFIEAAQTQNGIPGSARSRAAHHAPHAIQHFQP